jgi:IS30 family transposase
MPKGVKLTKKEKRMIIAFHTEGKGQVAIADAIGRSRTQSKRS